MNNFNDVLKKFDIRKSSGKLHQAICPAHEDHNPSLTITEINDKLLLKCHAECKPQDIVAAVGLQMKDLFLEPKPIFQNIKRNKKVAQYDYCDEEGILQYSNIKYVQENGGKKFSYCSYDRDMKQIWSLKGVKIIPYRLPELIEAVMQKKLIFIPEGEKDCDKLSLLGLEATTNPFGAGQWKSQYNNYLVGANVVLLEDNDEPGRKHIKILINELRRVVNSIKVIRFTELRDKSDVTDWLDMGHTKVDLIELVNKAKFVFQKNSQFETEKENIKSFQEELYIEGKVPNHEKIIELVLSRYNLKSISENNKKSFVIYQDGFWNKIENGTVGQFFKNYLYDKHKTGKMIKEIINTFEYAEDILINYEDFDKKDNYINLCNFTFDLVNFVSVNQKPEDFFSHKLPYEYNPKATCPKFLKAINLYAGNDNLWINLLQEIMGYCLTGTLEHQVMFWFYGHKGRNGKGTIIRIIAKLLGNVFSLPDFDSKQLVENRFYKVRLKGKRVIVAGDLPKKIYNVSSIKSLTGGDEQVSDVKFGKPESFIPKSKLIFAMNSLPQIERGENKEPLRKRIIFLYFQNQIENPNSNIEAEIMNELSGIFNWAIEGLKRLQATKEFTKHPDSETLLNQFLDEQRPEDIFIQHYLKYDEEYDGVFNKEIWDKYKIYISQYTGEKNWVYDRNEYITSPRTLLNSIRQNFPKLKTETIYSQKHGGQMTFCYNLKLIS